MNTFSIPRTWAALCLALLVVLGLGACAGPQPADYAREQPRLDLRQYFNGTLDAYGVFTDRSGRVVKRFVVVMTCSWSGPPGQETGVLDEVFTYSDGTRERRVWTLKRTAEGRYVGTAADVVGQAQGEESGNAFRFAYTLRLPVDGRTYEVQFDDWMYLMDQRVMLNKAVMSKFGIRLGEVTLSFVKR
jgi:hypothetical protein